MTLITESLPLEPEAGPPAPGPSAPARMGPAEPGVSAVTASIPKPSVSATTTTAAETPASGKALAETRPQAPHLANAPAATASGTPVAGRPTAPTTTPGPRPMRSLYELVSDVILAAGEMPETDMLMRGTVSRVAGPASIDDTPVSETRKPDSALPVPSVPGQYTIPSRSARKRRQRGLLSG